MHTYIHTYIHTLTYTFTYTQAYSYSHSYAYTVQIHIHIWQRLKNIGLVTGPGGLFATRLVTESGGLATSPPRDKAIEDYSTLQRDPRQGFVIEGPRQRYVTQGGGWTATNPHFESQPYIYIYICI